MSINQLRPLFDILKFDPHPDDPAITVPVNTHIQADEMSFSGIEIPHVRHMLSFSERVTDLGEICSNCPGCIFVPVMVGPHFKIRDGGESLLAWSFPAITVRVEPSRSFNSQAAGPLSVAMFCQPQLLRP